jgi:hypothetical protein
MRPKLAQRQRDRVSGYSDFVGDVLDARCAPGARVSSQERSPDQILVLPKPV